MSIVSSSTSRAITTESDARRGGIVRSYLELTKARLSALVVMSTAVGFIIAGQSPIDWILLAWTILGTTLAAAAASIFNQLIEINLDAKMKRTRDRPLPTGAISPRHGFILAMLTGYAGIAVLGLFVNLLAAGLALVTILIYVLIYTPMKTRSSFNTLVGAVCGAIPPMIGWAAASGRLEIGAWILGAILFVWQLPHFLSLAWLYREDYRQAGFAMLSVGDPRGDQTSRIVLLTSILLIPLGLMVTLAGLAGWWFTIGSILLGSWLIQLGIKLHLNHSDDNARRVFLASILYLTLLMTLLVIDREPIGTIVIPTFAQESADISTASIMPDFRGQ